MRKHSRVNLRRFRVISVLLRREERQVNEYPALLVIHAAGQELAHQGFFEAVRAMRKGLERSRLLELIDPGRLPRNPRILITLLRKGMTVPAMVLCAIKYRDRLRDMPRP